MTALAAPPWIQMAPKPTMTIKSNSRFQTLFKKGDASSGIVTG
jgi:hypothetical protein